MNNDLISREALIEAITSETRNEFEFICLSRLFEIIDNAPTVELTEEQAIDKLHETGWLIRHDKEMTERPQGEWIEKYSDYGVYYRCSICHKMPPNYECDYKEGAIKTNFCPNCGADMRKEESSNG